MEGDIIILITVMSLVTYFPRLLPFLSFSFSSSPRTHKNNLKIIPINALGALIVPGVFKEAQEFFIAGSWGIVVCIIVSFFRKDILLPVHACVVITFILMQTFP